MPIAFRIQFEFGLILIGSNSQGGRKAKESALPLVMKCLPSDLEMPKGPASFAPLLMGKFHVYPRYQLKPGFMPSDFRFGFGLKRAL
jgi:hypothetical protein